LEQQRLPQFYRVPTVIHPVLRKQSFQALQAIEPDDVGNGLVEVLIKAVTGFINTIIQAAAAPFLAALDYFTKETPLMAKNSGVFNLMAGNCCYYRYSLHPDCCPHWLPCHECR
jgi:hypothetical protein